MATNTKKADDKLNTIAGLVSAEVAKKFRVLAVLDDKNLGDFAGAVLTEYVNANPVQITRG